MTDDLIRLPSARRLDIRLLGAEGKIEGSVSRGEERGRQIAIAGRIARGGELEDLLGTRDRSDAALLATAYERFGWGGFLRLGGAFAAGVAERELVLVRSPTFGAERTIYFREAQDSLHFSTDIADVKGDLDEEAIRRWLIHRLWMPRTSTPFSGVSQLEQGSVLLASREGTKRERYWTFTPFGIPRLLPEAEAQREVERAIAAVLEKVEEADLIAEPPALDLFRAASPRASSSDRRWEFGALEQAYRAIGWPVALSEAAEVAALMRSDRPLISDLGMREVLGATETGLGAWVESISSAIGASPNPKTLLGVLRSAAPIDRRLTRSRLVPSLVESARRMGHRWKRHLPPTLADRIALADPEPSIVEPVTGDPFVDRRFAETLDPGLAARHRAIASVRPVIAPFLDPRLVELLFSLPKQHFVGEGRIMRVVRGGVPLEAPRGPKLPRYPDDHPYRSLPRRRFFDLERDTDEDRWLGLGAFLSAWSA